MKTAGAPDPLFSISGTAVSHQHWMDGGSDDTSQKIVTQPRYGHSQRVFVTQSPFFCDTGCFSSEKAEIFNQKFHTKPRTRWEAAGIPILPSLLLTKNPHFFTPSFLYPLKILSFFPSCFYPSKINFSSFFWHFHSKSPLSYPFLLKPYFTKLFLVNLWFWMVYLLKSNKGSNNMR